MMPTHGSKADARLVYKFPIPTSKLVFMLRAEERATNPEFFVLILIKKKIKKIEGHVLSLINYFNILLLSVERT